MAPAPGQAPWGVHHDDPPPFNRLRGPVHARGPQSGVVRQHGADVLAWGEPGRADLTFSVAKSYLALLAGVAQRDGLLPDEDEPVVARLPGIGFDSKHNRGVTWTHLLTQTSEWEGHCFDLPDTVDRWRQVAHDPRRAAGPKGGARPLQSPGSYWEYNDVRINQLALALLHLFRRPLPEVFLEQLLRPSVAATASPGAATTTPGSTCRASAACNPFLAERTGAPGCRSAPATRRASASSCSTAASSPGAL